MPTKQPRHTITETPAVREPLDALRRIEGPRLDLAELVVLGARTRPAELQAAETEAREARGRIADRVRRGESLGDVEAADAVRREGWARS